MYLQRKENTNFVNIVPQNRQICFCLGQRKNKFVLIFSSFLAFKQTKEQILFQAQPLKMINKNSSHFRVTVNIF